ncbi:MAG: sigma-70 family RNA polymerase sigma factor [Candidatus Eisenbacteria sp.]|nr:sigma-70 family RNA polymerase sigma factor [Candidatus Eisenbacteria bacterium]
MTSDEELFLRCKQGDARAWESLIRHHQDRVLNLAYQFMGNREEARDLAQEIFVRVYEKMEQYDPARPFQAWFNRLARNLCIDRYRHRKRDQVIVDTPVDDFPSLAASSEPPDKRFERQERVENMHQALNTLGEISREAIVLKDLQEHSIEEMAEMLRLPIGTVKSRIHRARIELGRAILRLRNAGAQARLRLRNTRAQPEGSNGL